MKIILMLLLIPSLASAGDLYAYLDSSLGGVIGEKNDFDGTLPYWGGVGLEYEQSDNWAWRFGYKHRSNADLVGNGEYELNVIEFGFKAKVCLTCKD